MNRKSQHRYVRKGLAVRFRQYSLKRRLSFYDRFSSCKSLHTQFGSDPRTACHITVGYISLKGQTDSLRFRSRKPEHIPPLLRHGGNGIFSLSMCLVIINHSAYSTTFIRFQIGGNSISGGFRFTVKPPHFRTGRVLRIGKFFPCLLHSNLLRTFYTTENRENKSQYQHNFYIQLHHIFIKKGVATI